MRHSARLANLILLICCYCSTVSANAGQAVVFLYHHVAEDTPAITSITPKAFSEQLAYLKANHFKVWPLHAIVDSLKNKKSIPDKVVAITFDDSYQSVFDTAFPLLKQYNYPFTIFVSTDSVDGHYNNQTSWDELRIMAKNGATIGNHSASHRHLMIKKEKQSDADWLQGIRLDISKAQQRIEEELGIAPTLFAYPYGEFDQAFRNLVQEMGFIGFGQQSGPIGSFSDLTALPRFPFSGQYTQLQDFKLKALSLPMPVRISSADNPLSNKNSRPTLTLKFDRLDFPPETLQCFGSMQGSLNIQWTEKNVASIKPPSDIPVGRSRYNCTAPKTDSDGTTRYYWVSHPWIRLTENHQWLID